MRLFKNKIGRPSNSSRKKKRIIIIIIITIIILLLLLINKIINNSISGKNKNIIINKPKIDIVVKNNLKQGVNNEKIIFKNINKEYFYKRELYNSNDEISKISNEKCIFIKNNKKINEKINLSYDSPYVKETISLYEDKISCEDNKNEILHTEKEFILTGVVSTLSNELKYNNYIKIKGNVERNVVFTINNTTNKEYYYKVIEHDSINLNNSPIIISECKSIQNSSVRINKTILLSKNNLKEYSIKVKLYSNKNTCLIDKTSSKSTDIIDSSTVQYKI